MDGLKSGNCSLISGYVKLEIQRNNFTKNSSSFFPKGSLQKKETVKRVTSSLKVGRYDMKNHILFEEKNSDMEGRYKNQFC